MIKFLLKGLLRDKDRSLLPIIIVALGVMLTVFLTGYLAGVFNDVIRQNANFETGHVKIMTKAYADNQSQMPNDLALLGVAELTNTLNKQSADLEWVSRIRFGGLLDVPDVNGQTKGQGPAIGLAVNLFSENNKEIDRLNIKESLVWGSIPQQAGEALVSYEFANKLSLQAGDTITYVGATMNGSMSFKNFIIIGAVRFGVGALDRGALVIDLVDARRMLDMDDGASELLGFYENSSYQSAEALALSKAFNKSYADAQDEFAPMMFALEEQNNLGEMLTYSNYMSQIIVIVLIFAMSVVLWNTGLLGGLRRYKEYGIRLALGESKNQIYVNAQIEAILIGFIGSTIGTILGLLATYYMQEVGVDLSDINTQGSMLIPSTLRAQLIPSQLYIGYIPGVLAMLLGTMLSGIGIYKRETASLFKELEV
ncbi:MAG: putative ABC transport system permease protein [Marivirga sp.]|jgi:putative ABC transport system permease protein